MTIKYVPYRKSEEYLYIAAQYDEDTHAVSDVLKDIGEKFYDFGISSISFNERYPAVLLEVSEFELESEGSGWNERFWLTPEPVPVRGRKAKVDWSKYESQSKVLKMLAEIFGQEFNEEDPRLEVITR